MITLRAVVEIGSSVDETATPWPVAARAPYSWLTLNGDCTDEEVGLFIATLANMIDVPSRAGSGETVDALLAKELLIVEGGLRISDMSTGTTVVPGCCAGLENWRDWGQTLAGVSPWLGHDPDPEVEFLDDRLRVWQDGRPNRHHDRWSGVYVDVQRSVLPALLTGVQRDLIGFLGALRLWAQRTGPGLQADPLVETVDRCFAISAALELPIEPT